MEQGQGEGDNSVIDLTSLSDIMEIDLTQQDTDDEDNNWEAGYDDSVDTVYTDHTANNLLWYDPTGY